jgi:uncharacterized protein (DUF2147 family)
MASSGMWRVVRTATLSVAMALAGTALVSAQTPIEGVWRTLLESEVTIGPCPEGLCGVLSKIVVPTENLTPEEAAAAQQMDVTEFTDVRNKDPNLRNRPMLGLQILTLRPGSQPNIWDGEIYNPEDGNTYSGYMEMTGPDTVRLNGCVLFNVICRGEDWVRVPPAE